VEPPGVAAGAEARAALRRALPGDWAPGVLAGEEAGDIGESLSQNM
jgi:hypothetical protein